MQRDNFQQGKRRRKKDPGKRLLHFRGKKRIEFVMGLLLRRKKKTGPCTHKEGTDSGLYIFGK